MTTTPLRPDLAHRALLGRWLQVQAEVISRPWITGVLARRVYRPEQANSCLTEAGLRALYDSLAGALETGRYAALDNTISAVTRDGYLSGYPLNDLLLLLSSLKSEVWQAVTVAFPPQEALMYVRSIDAVFQTGLSYQARVFADLVQYDLASELDRTRGQLIKLDQTKSRFISIAAHELKTPLTLIQGYSDILNRELGANVSNQVHLAISGLAAGARRLLTTVNDMIAVSQIDAQSLQLNFQPMSLPHILQMVMQDLRANLEERALNFRMKPIPPELEAFYADPQRVYQIFEYVIGNAIKYTPDGGSITITIDLLDAPIDADRFVEVGIVDTGIGVAPEDIPHLFDKFYSKTDISRHSSGRTKFKGGGSGLGLSVVKGIVEAHGGKIVVESAGYDEETCPGTTVRIYLPVRYEPPSSVGRDRLGLTT
ncbi:MAG: HAMP domain-containing histidine kinase [Chloroflexi bacterium]|nr:HAMP domain-containing histidine kinase [Chloroflexota bacterium]